MPKPKHLRPTYRQHSEAVRLADIKRACAPGSVFFDVLTDERLTPIDANTEFGRGKQEGRRELAMELQEMAISEETE